MSLETLTFSSEESFGLFVEGLRYLELYEKESARPQPKRTALRDCLQAALDALGACAEKFPDDLLPRFYLGLALTMRNQMLYALILAARNAPPVEIDENSEELKKHEGAFCKAALEFKSAHEAAQTPASEEEKRALETARKEWQCRRDEYLTTAGIAAPVFQGDSPELASLDQKLAQALAACRKKVDRAGELAPEASRHRAARREYLSAAGDLLGPGVQGPPKPRAWPLLDKAEHIFQGIASSLRRVEDQGRESLLLGIAQFNLAHVQSKREEDRKQGTDMDDALGLLRKLSRKQSQHEEAESRRNRWESLVDKLPLWPSNWLRDLFYREAKPLEKMQREMQALALQAEILELSVDWRRRLHSPEFRSGFVRILNSADRLVDYAEAQKVLIDLERFTLEQNTHANMLADYWCKLGFLAYIVAFSAGDEGDQAQRKRLLEAQGYLQTALQLKPNWTSAQIYLVQVYQALGDHRKAGDLLDAIVGKPEPPTAPPKPGGDSKPPEGPGSETVKNPPQEKTPKSTIEACSGKLGEAGTSSEFSVKLDRDIQVLKPLRFKTSGRTHHFHANAIALGGQIGGQIVPTQASLALPSVGGHVSLRVQDFRFAGILSFKSAYSQTTGCYQDEKSGSWVTLATSTVEDLNILEIVTVNRIVARISIEHSTEGHHPRATFIGSQLEGLRVGGESLEVTLDTDVFGHGKMGGFPKEHPARDVEFLKKISSRYHEQYDGEKDHVLCSLMADIKGRFPGKRADHVLEVPDFGKIFLGELIVEHNSFCLTMIRSEILSPFPGDIVVATSFVGGSTEL